MTLDLLPELLRHYWRLVNCRPLRGVGLTLHIHYVDDTVLHVGPGLQIGRILAAGIRIDG